MAAQDSSRKWMFIGGGVVASVALVIGFQNYPPQPKDSTGTIGSAQRHHEPQISEADVKVSQDELTTWLQSDTFDRIVKDPEARRLFANEAVQRVLAESARNQIELAANDSRNRNQVQVADDANKKLSVADDANKKLSVADDANKKLSVADDANKQLSVADDANKKLSVADDANKKLSVADDANKQLSVADDLRKQLSAADFAMVQAALSNEAIRNAMTSDAFRQVMVNDALRKELVNEALKKEMMSKID